MNRANALRGTFMGRRVKTEGEALEEIAGMNNEPLVPAVDLPADSSGTTGVTEPGDIFSFSQLRMDLAGTILLERLEVPEGTWKLLYLHKGEYSCCELNQQQWNQYSYGLVTVHNGFRFSEPPGTFRADRLATTKGLYWFMRAAYQSRNDPACAEIIHTLKNFFSSRPILTADRLEVESNTTSRDRLLTKTYGWQLDHPLEVYNSQDKPEPASYPIISAPIKKTVCALFGDPQPERISEVYSWLTGDARPMIFKLNPLHIQNQGAVCLEPNNLVSVIPIDSPRSALGLFAHAEDFTARGAKP